MIHASTENRDPAEPDAGAGSGTQAAAMRLRAVNRRIERACAAASRPAGSVRLLAVSKTWEAERVLELAALGQRAFAENYLQEALSKIESCRAQSAGLGERTPQPLDPEPPRAERADLQPLKPKPHDLEWHFIGPIQSNKTRPIAENFDWVHSIDRERIARRLSEQRPSGMTPLEACVQVNVSGEASKSGCAPEEAVALALAVAAMPGLRLRGLMAIPEPDHDEGVLRRRFALLASLAGEIRNELARLDPGGSLSRSFDTLSMGMSDDLEAAIAEGATIVRVGTALFGKRRGKPGEASA